MITASSGSTANVMTTLAGWFNIVAGSDLGLTREFLKTVRAGG
jgi:hypothetical protein